MKRKQYGKIHILPCILFTSMTLFFTGCPAPEPSPEKGTVTIRIINLSDYIGKNFVYLISPIETDGTSFTDPYGYQESVQIESDTLESTLMDSDSVDIPVEFAGGENYAAGGFIDIDQEVMGPPVTPDSDYITLARNFEIDGNMVVEFSFPGDFLAAGPDDSLNGSMTPPSGLSVEPVSGTSVDLFWNDNSSNETGFCIEYKKETDEDYPADNRHYTMEEQTSTEIQGLSPGTSHSFRMFAYGYSGNSEYSEPVTNSTSAGSSQHVLVDWFYLGTTIAGADLDGDGDMDMVGTAFDGEYPSAYRDDVVWFRNDGTDVFTEFTIKDVFTGAWCVAVSDFDDDGDTDVAAAAYYDNKISWFENNGNGSFTEHPVTSSFVEPRSLFPVDLDGDGDTDFIASGDTSIGWFQNNSGVFTESVIKGPLSGDWYVSAADMDGDGDEDVIAGGNSSLVWFENDGSENFTEHQFEGDSDGGKALAAGDLDGDGDIDIISSGSQYITLYKNGGSGSYTADSIYDSGSYTYGYRSIEASDMDSDGDLDISGPFITSSLAAMLWLENNGTGSFSYRQIASDFYYGRHTHAIDFDGDGDLDLLGVDQARIKYWEMGY